MMISGLAALCLALAWPSRAADAPSVSVGVSDADTARADANRAQALQAAGKNDEALGELRSAVAVDPLDRGLVRALADALFFAGRYSEALIYADHLCARQAADQTKTQRAGELVLRARVELALARDDDAKSDLKAALKLSRHDLEGLRAMIDYWQKRGRLAKALSFADRLVKSAAAAGGPARAVAYADRARLRMELKSWAAAEADLREALRADPRSALADSQLAECLTQEGRAADARAYSTGAPLAILDLKLGDPQKALAVLIDALSANPEDLGALNAMVDVLEAQGRLADAVSYADRAVTVSASLPAASLTRALLRRGKLAMMLKDYDVAAQTFKKAADASSEAVEPRLQWAQALDRQAKYKEALEAMDAVFLSTASASEAARVLTTRFAIAFDSGDHDGALASLRRAIALDARETCLENPSFIKRNEMDPSYFDACIAALPNEPSLLADRGVVRYLGGQIDSSVEDFKAALKLKPDDLEAALSLCAALQERMQKDQARIVIAHALAAAAGRKSDPLYRQAQDLQRALASAN